MSHHTHPFIPFIVLLYILLNLKLTVILTSAQVPHSAASAAYATVDERTLYIFGGNSKEVGWGTQFFSLDLTKSGWDVTNPPWTPLSIGSITMSYAVYNTMTISKTQYSLILWSYTGKVSAFDIQGGSRSQVLQDRDFTREISGGNLSTSVADPSSGIIYVPYFNDSMEMVEFNPATLLQQSLPVSNDIPGVLDSYGVVWSTKRKSIILSGGKSTLSPNNKLVEYVPSLSNWKVLNTTGPFPGELTGHCMISAYNGSKIIVFGGYPIHPDIYILDMEELRWTKGESVDPALARYKMVCSVSGDNFLAWGGTKNPIGGLSEHMGTSPIIYNIKDNKWTTQYIISLPPIITESPSIPVAQVPSIGALVGGTVSAFVAVVAISAFMYRRHVRKRQTPVNPRIRDPEKVGCPPHTTIGNSDTPRSPQEGQQMQLANVYQSHNPQFGQGETAGTRLDTPSGVRMMPRAPQDVNQDTDLPDDISLLEEQIAHVQMQLDKEYDQKQVRLEELKLEQQEHLQKLRQKLDLTIMEEKK
ncbi:hypothetical protein BGX27_006003 [Mortierella sp. AM989]|nr:hypothetical protein BGX27_006003 [Mortierella sp. AM989]